MTHATLDVRSGVTGGKSSATLTLTPVGVAPGQRMPLFIGRDELFFFTRKWQEGERESAEARERGELRTFDDGAALVAWLDAPED